MFYGIYTLLLRITVLAVLANCFFLRKTHCIQIYTHIYIYMTPDLTLRSSLFSLHTELVGFVRLFKNCYKFITQNKLVCLLYWRSKLFIVGAEYMCASWVNCKTQTCANSSGGQSPAFHHRDPGSIPGNSVWDLWWMKRLCDSVLSYQQYNARTFRTKLLCLQKGTLLEVWEHRPEIYIYIYM